ncbi:hydrolase [Motiliproteus sp. MSK22-1]|uniref:hydrolase n=1 Tax=Motiliproteus sp. MSK22-1 TaxID=1897630 RepID=UPI000978AACF|nr:hydrolase [Motiliproteus sp. MSK22-1]OMH27133.1 hydrolase [Motiliproteus sp. MSK22-1]
MLIDAQQSALLVIDVQEKLLPGVHQNEQLVNSCKWLMGVAKLMKIPTLGTEQYPRGVGPTTETLRELLPEEDFIAKTVFSCANSKDCSTRIDQLNRQQIVICGMEAHVCVLQTALELKDQGKDVFVVVDAISARNPTDTEFAIRRMDKAGIHLVTREMVGFEWIRRSDAPEFKDFSIRFLQ